MYGCILGSFFSASQVGKGYSQNGAHGTRPHKQKELEDNQAHRKAYGVGHLCIICPDSITLVVTNVKGILRYLWTSIDKL